jgi:predicted DNA-binding transcriptional regulator YafY
MSYNKSKSSRAFFYPGYCTNTAFLYNSQMYGKNLVKLFKSIDILAKKEGATISELQAELGISRRSVYRLLDTLKDLNFPLRDDRAASGLGDVWKLNQEYLTNLPDMRLQDLKLTKEEIILLFFLFTRANVFKNTELEKYLQTLKEKLDIFLPENLRHPKAMTKLDDIFIPSGENLGDYSNQEDILDDITDSIVHLNRCIVTYHSFIYNEVKRFQIDPLKLFEHSGALYLFARVIDFDSISIITVKRVRHITVIDKHFDFPEGFNPEEILDSASELIIGEPVSARIWFSADAATTIKSSTWGIKQEITEQPDRSIVLSISTSGILDIKKWVLSFGSEAKVIEPRFLIEEIEAEIERMRSTYKS